MTSTQQAVPQWRLAVAAQALYLVNLTLLPGLAFLVLLWLKTHPPADASGFARAHLDQATIASLWAGALLLLAVAIFLLAGGWQRPAAWVFALLYLITVHSAFVLCGVVALARAMSGRPYRYPLPGPK